MLHIPRLLQLVFGVQARHSGIPNQDDTDQAGDKTNRMAVFGINQHFSD